ncbi:MAG: US12 family protein [Planctomycetaceae bacterium]|nr:US12 family protein [Planctomycetaceae bacterium]
MSYAPEYDSSQERDLFAIDAAADARAGFIRRTYAHLFAAVAAFACLTGYFLTSGVLEGPMMRIIQNNQWFLVFGGFMVVSWIASWMANSGASPAVQYFGLILYTVAQAVFFVPLLMFAQAFAGGNSLIMQAGALTLIIFGGLTLTVMITGADFSFLRTGLALAGLATLGLIVVSFFMGWNLGLWFVLGVIVLMCGYILYDTSNVLHHYRTDQYVAASLALFASLATLFWYMIRLLMILNSRD